VIDAEAGDDALARQLQRQRVHRGEHLRVLDRMAASSLMSKKRR
jgi:hypothetical protein